jgi:CBS domain containing-hemolysin-like protein
MFEFLQSEFWALVVIGVCVLLSAAFAAAETAITALGTLKARHLVETEAKAHHLNLWLQHPSRVLTTVLLFNTVVKILASAVATNVASHYSKDQAIGIATGVTTFLVLVFGEVIPKAFGRAHAESVGIFGIRFVNVAYRITYPAVWVLSELANFMIRRFGRPTSLQPTITEEELEFLIKIGEKSGAIEPSKREMITGVFDFDETKVREIMTPRTDVAAIEKSDTFHEATSLIIQTGHSRIPVYEERIDNVVGIIFAKDLLRHAAQGQMKTPLSHLMRQPLFVPDSKPIMDAFKDLKRTKNHMAVIIDEYGGMAGVVTMEDILEEIVGDIQDEFDKEEAQVLKIDKGVYDVSGAMNISEFREYFELDEAFEAEVEGEADTIGGWMTQFLGDMPEVGQTVTRGPLTIEVSEVGRHRIERLRVAKILASSILAPNPA